MSNNNSYYDNLPKMKKIIFGSIIVVVFSLTSGFIILYSFFGLLEEYGIWGLIAWILIITMAIFSGAALTTGKIKTFWDKK